MKAKWGVTIGAALSAVALAACGSSGGTLTRWYRRPLHLGRSSRRPDHAVKAKAGDNAQALEVQITEGGASFKLRNGEQATGSCCYRRRPPRRKGRT